MLTLSNVTKRYGSKLAVDDISFHISKGQIVGFLGVNGAGKTTTMNIITGYISASQGSVEVDGYDIMTEPNQAKSLIGYLPEQPPLYPDFTVDESLKFIYALKKVKLDRKKHLDEVCEQTHIQDVRRRLTRNLSKGYKQRLGLALSLIGDPPILILDEPTIGLDPVQIIEIRNLIKELSGTHTVLLSSHILQEIQAVANRIILIHHGSLIADDTAENLIRRIKNPNHTIQFQLTGDKEKNLQLLRSVKGVLSLNAVENEKGLCTYTLEVDNPDLRKEMFFMQVGSKHIPLIELRSPQMTLEDAFIALTTSAKTNQSALTENRKKSVKEKIQ